ncbi:methylaspartate mutase accessory protein GlmL [Sediminicurvatus halobius]|uniref:MutL protein n=1 Tax=Sediminicurvatus halobius TaxID=2182432 RepID=A0A2U2N5X1_9GAMM|nr:methylaspartate mutase accessory protein GlmL [Spiribacter halobius]PWG64566.1 MutL protein [Spiribacter halobius]UEX79114.1 glutamate mutase L [Spiribacter halobius]
MQAGHALLIDFGSTYTKLRAVDLEARRLAGSAQGPSTIATDITEGLQQALNALEARLGALPAFRHRLASSSAAGGLRMVTIGLVRDLTAEAARRAALGAGARVIGTFTHHLTRADIATITDWQPDVVLLAGGTDGGNREVILHNAAALGSAGLRCPVVLAGNRSAADEARERLGALEVRTAENVMPRHNELNIEPARAAIRQVFIDRIVEAKGIERARERLDAVLMPTPAAVLEAARLLADGAGTDRPGLGDVLVVDPGGATTDVHSVCAGLPAEGVIPRGLPEPRVKRTVEGDLGMRHNAATLVETVGIAAIAREAGVPEDTAEAICAGFAGAVERLPQTDAEHAVDAALARLAVGRAVARHAGTLETVYTAAGAATVQHGKNLSGVSTVIGTGGALAHARDAGSILAATAADPHDPTSLRPRAPRFLLDREYLLYACGLLASVAPETAYDLALASLEPLAGGEPP